MKCIRSGLVTVMVNGLNQARVICIYFASE